MQYLEHVCTMVTRYVDILTWRDYCEVFFFSTVIYYFSRWLNKEHDKVLLLLFYGYCVLVLVAYYAQLTTISMALFIGAPVTLMLIGILHQERLQKNFITYKQRIIGAHDEKQWPQELIAACLQALNKQRRLICMIERTDSLQVFFTQACIINAHVKKELIAMALDACGAEKPLVLWLNHHGILRALQVTLADPAQNMLITTQAQTLPYWYQQALVITSKTDSLIITTCPETGLFDLILQESIAESLTAHQTLIFLQRYIDLNNVNKRHTSPCA